MITRRSLVPFLSVPPNLFPRTPIALAILSRLVPIIFAKIDRAGGDLALRWLIVAQRP